MEGYSHRVFTPLKEQVTMRRVATPIARASALALATQRRGLVLTRSLPLARRAVAPPQHHFAPLLRGLCAGPSVQEAADELSEAYQEAREFLEDAEDGKGTVYFEDDLQDARESVTEMLEKFEESKGRLPEAEREQLVQLVGLKMEELRSRLQVLIESLINDDD